MAILLAALHSAAPLRAATPGVLRIGTPGDYAPYSWRDNTGAYLGSDVALARALALSMGARLQFVPTTWSALVADARSGRFDIAVGGISITAERSQVLGFSESYASDRKQPVVRCGEQRRYDTEREINRPETRLVVNPGGTNERFARERFPAATLTLHGDNRSVFAEILARRADVMVTDAIEGRLQQRSGAGLCVAKVRARWSPASKAVLLASDGDLKRSIDRSLQALGGARAYRRLSVAWESYAWDQPQEPAVRLAALIDERLAIVTEVARTKWNTQAAIEDPVREASLLETLRVRAATLGVSAARADSFFGAQIEAAKLLQRELFAQWQREQRGQFASVADLALDIRPEIDRVTGSMLEQLARVPASASLQLPRASTMALISPAAINMARAPLLSAAGT